MATKREATAERETKPKPPPPPPATWRVVINSTPRKVVAVYAKISTRGVLVFTDSEGNLLKAFAAGTWSGVETQADPFDNQIIYVSADDEGADG